MIFSVLEKERVFIQDLSVTQSTLTSNEQLMKAKLRTFARKQILHKPIKKHVNMTEISRSHD